MVVVVVVVAIVVAGGACGDSSSRPPDAGLVDGAGDAGASDGPGSEVLAVRPRRHDFIGVYRPSSGTWLLEMQRPGWVEPAPSTGEVRELVFGEPDGVPLVGDWDGDGVETLGVWHAGVWSLANDLGGPAVIVFTFGEPTDVPVVGDWDGDGTATPGVFRAGAFHLRNDQADPVSVAQIPDIVVAFGEAGDIPVAGDWDGDGADTIGVYRPSDRSFHLANQLSPAPTAELVLPFGDPGDVPVVGDWNGDGTWGIGVRSGATFFLRNAFDFNEAEMAVAFGLDADIPVVGNWRPEVTRGFASSPLALAPASGSSDPGAAAAFFPLGAYCQAADSFSKWKGRGINTMMDVPVAEDFDDWTKAANENGLKMIRNARPRAEADLGEPNLLAWLITDEPDGPGAIDWLRPRYEQLRALDASRPILFTMRGDLVLDPADGVCNGPGDFGDVTDCYPGLLTATDWVLHDYYPVRMGQPLDRLGQIIDKLTRWSGGKPQLAFIEAAKIEATNDRPPPTADEFRAEIWDAIIHGARGIFYFTHGYCDPCQTPDGMTPELVGEMTRQNALITAEARHLQGAIDPPLIGCTVGHPLEATWRVGSEGTKTFYVLNLGAQRISSTVRLQGFVPTAPLAVVNEARTVGASGQSAFVDSFEPYALHIYRVK